MENIVIDFVKELAACRVEGTQLPFYPEKVKGYTEQEIELIAKNCNLDIHGQFRDFLLQMGKCSGGLLWGDEFYMYSYKWSLKNFLNYQKSAKQDDDMFDKNGKIDPIGKKIFGLTREYETYFYYLFTDEYDDYVWFLDSADDAVWEKTNETLLDHLKYYVEYKTKQTRFIDFDLTEEQIDGDITGRLL